MTSFHLERTINKRIHLRKTEKFEIFRKSFLSLHFNPLSHVIYMQVHEVLRNYLATMRASDNNFLFYLRHIYQLENKTPSNTKKKWKPFFSLLSLVSYWLQKHKLVISAPTMNIYITFTTKKAKNVKINYRLY